MSFKTVIQALETQIEDYSTISEYVDEVLVFIGFKSPLPRSEYMVIIEPVTKNPLDDMRSTSPEGTYREDEYLVQVYARTILTGRRTVGQIIGSSTKKGLLDFADDIEAAIISNRSLSYDSAGSSISKVNADSNFALSESNRYLSVKINGIERTGWDVIDCGSSTLTGDQVAANIQTAIRAMKLHADDGMETATCVFSSSTKKFTITSATIGPTSTVVVTAGASNDCSTLLGFDDPTEVIGKKIVSLKTGIVEPLNDLYPVRYRIIPVTIREHVKLF